jgi:hypothetical protein
MKPYCAHCQTSDHWGQDCPNKGALPRPQIATKATPKINPLLRIHNCPYCQCGERIHVDEAAKQKAYRERKKERESKAHG